MQENPLNIELAPLKKQEKLLETEIEEMSSELKLIEEELLDESIYDVAHKIRLKNALEKQGRLKSLLKNKEGQWYDLQKKLEFH